MGRIPSRLDRFPADLANPGLELSGVYEDGWVGGTASLTLQQPTGGRVLVVRGMVPKIGEADFHSEVEIRIDDNSVVHQSLGTGVFLLSTPVRDGAGKRRITIAMNPVQQLPDGDGRMVGARLQSIGFEPAASASGPVDIVKRFGVQLGAGWGALETYRGETFRWVENDARILLSAVPSQDVELSVVVEPGPGVSPKDLLLKVLDSSGKQVAAAPAQGRKEIKFYVPVEAGKPGDFRLHIDGGGKPTPNDPRILNFRVFEVSAQPWPPRPN